MISVKEKKINKAVKEDMKCVWRGTQKCETEPWGYYGRNTFQKARVTGTGMKGLEANKIEDDVREVKRSQIV